MVIKKMEKMIIGKAQQAFTKNQVMENLISILIFAIHMFHQFHHQNLKASQMIMQQRLLLY